jgi:aminoglycoside/choline kinase family phosphotransferase/dTDP-glucose pyrophosphorylase
MKALILAAGFGTRLRPHTQVLPKALFPVAGVPVLERMIANLKRAGCTEVAVNGHHLAENIQLFLEENDFGLPIHYRSEPEILGTGGAIRNLSDFFDDGPFIVVNADIVTDVSLSNVYRNHLNCGALVSLVLHDRPPFNQVRIDQENRILSFERYLNAKPRSSHRKLAFTGIHLLNPDVFTWIPENGFCDIISVYSRMIEQGITIRGDVVNQHYWQDMGTPDQFRKTVVDAMAPKVFHSVFSTPSPCRFETCELSGDGSDRNWFRLQSGDHRLIVADHGITLEVPGSEFNAFINIGKHLYRKGIPVPEIYTHDAFSGLVFLEDLGETHLQQAVEQAVDIDSTENLYRQAIDTLFRLTTNALEGFVPAWTCQSESYDESIIVKKECEYFVEAFANGYLNLEVRLQDLSEEFILLARRTLEHGIAGLIHRDFQSRNIMIKNEKPHLIDFQGARLGPVQYDLASLLIDPYANLAPELKRHLLDYAAGQAARLFSCDPNRFLRGYKYCCVTRNLQMLGAFGFLCRIKKKWYFQNYIPAASKMLARHLYRADGESFPKLMAIAEKIGTVKIPLTNLRK